MKMLSKEIELEERIECVLCAQELELDGNAYVGKYELNDVKSIIKFISGKLRKNDKDERISYLNKDTEKEIILSKRSAEKLATHYTKDETYQKSIAHIPQIIECMKFLEEMPPDEGKTKYDKYEYYITKVSIDGEPYVILSTVGCTEQGIYYDQNVFKGTLPEVFKKAETTGDTKHDRLAKILQKIKKGS
jgi:hypothetical protein